jgi:hypothetical protein
MTWKRKVTESVEDKNSSEGTIALEEIVKEISSTIRS